MSEQGPRRIDLETPRQRFTAELKRSMAILHRELDKSASYGTAVLERGLGKVSGEQDIQGPIFFDEPVGDKLVESYEYSGEFRPREGVELIDAMSLKRQDCALFLQYARFHGKDKSASTAELRIGDQTYYGREALDRIHEAFPTFYPVPRQEAKAA
jgi:hypothetical protein